MARYGRCPRCNGWVPKEHDACPHCGAETGFLAQVTGLFGGLFSAARGEGEARGGSALSAVLPEGWTATHLFMGACVALFALGLLAFGRDPSFDGFGAALRGNGRMLLLMGANDGGLLADGQLFRLLTATFLHIGLLHLVMNMSALRSLGPAVEEQYGAGWMMVAWILTGVGGNVASWWWHGMMFANAGASGALFGFIGIGIVHTWRGGWRDRALRNQLIGWAVGGFVYGMFLRADNVAHAGGLAAGALFAFVLPGRRAMGEPFRSLGRVLGMLGVVAAIAAFVLAAKAGRALGI